MTTIASSLPTSTLQTIAGASQRISVRPPGLIRNILTVAGRELREVALSSVAARSRTGAAIVRCRTEPCPSRAMNP